MDLYVFCVFVCVLVCVFACVYAYVCLCVCAYECIYGISIFYIEHIISLRTNSIIFT